MSRFRLGTLSDVPEALVITLSLRLFYSAFAAVLTSVLKLDTSLIRSNDPTDNLANCIILTAQWQ